jgi:YbbR domain-containing protein
MNMRMLARNIRTFLLALVLGISVWVSAVSAADPNEVRTYPQPIPIEIVGKDPSLVLTSPIPDTTEISLRAPHSVWEILTTREDAIRATLDLTGLSAGEHTVTIKPMVALRPYQIVLEDPVTVNVTLESLATRTLPISLSLNGQPAAGYQTGEPSKELNKVTISGPESLVQRATRARVPVSLDGVRESINESVTIQILDAQNKALKGLTINPEVVRVNVPISPQAGYRDVAVKVIVQGQVATGYRLENIRVFPPVITVSASNPDLVNQLPGVVETQPLNLQDRKEDITTRLSLDLPDGITIVGAQTVQVQVSISAIQTSLPLPNLPINVNGLSEGLTAQVFPQTVDVIFSGPLPVLDTLSAKDITVSVDATGLQPGTYQLTPQVKVSVDNVQVESILPGTVEVVISVPSTPTPTAFPP